MADPGLPAFDEDDLLRLRSRIYESMGHLDELPGALMAAARRLNAAHAEIVAPTLDPSGDYFEDTVSTGMDMSAVRSFARESGTRDPWGEGLLTKYGLRPGLMLIGDQMCPRENVLRSPWQSAVLIPHDCGDPLGAFIAPTASQATKVSAIVFWRSRKSPRFELDAIDRLSLFVRDLERMARIALSLRAERREKIRLAAALNRAAEPIMILRADCTIPFANAAAETMLREEATFAAPGMKVAATAPAIQKQVAQALARAVELAQGSDIAIPRLGAPPLTVTITPTPGALPDQLDADAAAILTISDPQRKPELTPAN